MELGMFFGLILQLGDLFFQTIDERNLILVEDLLLWKKRKIGMNVNHLRERIRQLTVFSGVIGSIGETGSVEDPALEGRSSEPVKGFSNGA